MLSLGMGLVSAASLLKAKVVGFSPRAKALAVSNLLRRCPRQQICADLPSWADGGFVQAGGTTRGTKCLLTRG